MGYEVLTHRRITHFSCTLLLRHETRSDCYKVAYVTTSSRWWGRRPRANLGSVTSKSRAVILAGPFRRASGLPGGCPSSGLGLCQLVQAPAGCTYYTVPLRKAPSLFYLIEQLDATITIPSTQPSSRRQNDFRVESRRPHVSSIAPASTNATSRFVTDRRTALCAAFC